MADIIFPGAAPSGDLGNDLLPNNVDMTFWRGDSQNYNLVFTDSSNNPIDISGYTAKAAIKQSFSSTTKYDFTCTVHDTNQVTLYLPSSVSSTIPGGSYIWDFKLVDTTSGDQRTYLAGDVTVYDEVDS